MTIPLRPIPSDQQAKRSWRVLLNGKPIEAVEFLQLQSDQFGTLTYGWSPANYDTWAFSEAAGGGAVILPYCALEGELHVGVIRQDRFNCGGPVWNVSRGFRDSGEQARVGALRELSEEWGLEITEDSLVQLGPPANPNSAFFTTLGPDAGVHFYGVELPPESLVRTGNHYRLKSAASSTDSAEQISDWRFIHWTEATQLADMFTSAAVARLLAHLRQAPP